MKKFARYDLGELDGYDVKVSHLTDEEAAWCEQVNALLSAMPSRLKLLASEVEADLYIVDRDEVYDMDNDHLMSSYFKSGAVLGRFSSTIHATTASNEE
jgi:hypothetical protein